MTGWGQVNPDEDRRGFLILCRFRQSQLDGHHPLIFIQITIFEAEFFVKLKGDEVCYVHCRLDGVEAEFPGFL